MKAWSVAVGNVDPLVKASRNAVEYISKLDGFVGFFPHYPEGTLCFFDSENNAKIAKKKMESKGILTGRNVCEMEIDEPVGSSDRLENGRMKRRAGGGTPYKT